MVRIAINGTRDSDVLYRPFTDLADYNNIGLDITGKAGNDVLAGAGNIDVLNGGPGNDWLYGYEGNDQLLGGPGNDLLLGGSGDDVLDGGAGYNQLYGGDGNDLYKVGADDYAVIKDESGNDLLLVGHNALGVNATFGDGDITVKAGGATADLQIITGYGDSNVITGAGDDFLKLGDHVTQGGWIDEHGVANYFDIDNFDGNGNNTVSTGNGNDAVSTANGNDVIRLGNGNDYGGGGGGNDLIYGNQGNDTLYGGSGDDKLYGGAGDDYLWGGDGKDLMVGGAGNDIYVAGSGDTIKLGGVDGGSDTVQVNFYDFWDGAADLYLVGARADDTVAFNLSEKNFFHREGNNLHVMDSYGVDLTIHGSGNAQVTTFVNEKG